MAGMPVQVAPRPQQGAMQRPPQNPQGPPLQARPPVAGQMQQQPFGPAQMAANQQAFNQNMALAAAAFGGGPRDSGGHQEQQHDQQYPGQHDPVVLDNSTADAYFAPQSSTNVETVNVNFDASVSVYNTNSSAMVAESGYLDTGYVDSEYADAGYTGYVESTTVVDFNMSETVVADTSVYGYEEMAVSSDVWSTAAVDYSGGDWGDEW
ncbi:uncharacterized protein BCR38DRAFT_415955 [Pseudomassariella vexata]|uniref:Uncharacterized protein n=1 Tax=Pseudomassariella vexata TaxID=1141098 RepID=A0A1Y2EHS6_9PEZI|nr:uncharacterized protein BCR38DRAFT_415955 [Pseudomassariella vexata]ORY71113.1 hypothetical protein BCR38DRAFT_415955 [Pseudomassariella vexata]